LYNPAAQNTWDFPKITTTWSHDIYFVDMDYADESVVVVHCEAYTAMSLRENLSPSDFHQEEKSVLKLDVLQNVSYIWHENKAWR